MNSSASRRSTTPRWLLPALIPVAFLTACSTLSESAREWAQHAEAAAVAEAKITAATVVKATLPDMPPALVKCVRYGLAAAEQQKLKAKQKQVQTTAQKGEKAKKAAEKAKGLKPANEPVKQPATPSADEAVLAELQTADERAKCAVALLEWYRGAQKANQAATVKGKKKA